MNIKLVIFDLDGTLVDAYGAIIRSFNYTMKTLGYPLKDALTIRRAVGWGDENLLRPFVKKEDLKKAVEIYRKHHKIALLRYTKCLPSVKKVLSYLKKRKYYLSIASNRPYKFSLIIVRNLGLNKYFDYILCADKLKNIKPHPEILLKILSYFKVKPQEAIYVGDMTIDAQAGRAAGIKTIIVRGGSSSYSEIKKEKPFKVISRIEQLLKILKNKEQSK